ncbi:putative Apoptotic chromatin condensation inducer in the nucleus [Hypsibius exemplaris]|uniref:Apoptotic chromatin condensation inducer in the nucleus n=1 Tax=Hypsibius exemplaris TaxID=2072580 RepID=A0A1W0WBS5_HYPEX|nr:putative Apoptotic chromatin condensation inducer in the nucleus [Hypsibius exemplaris]
MDHIMISGRPLQDLKVTELKDELAKRNLSKTGNKAQLSTRLGEYLQANPENDDAPQQRPPEEPRKGSPPKNVVPSAGDSIIAQYLAERESKLAESLEHKRKIQSAEPKSDEIEIPPPRTVITTSPHRNVSAPPPQQEPISVVSANSAAAASASHHEEEEEMPASAAQDLDGNSNSRRKGRKSEPMRRSTRNAGDKTEEPEQEEAVVTPPPVASVITPTASAKAEPPPANTSPAQRKLKSPSPKKEELIIGSPKKPDEEEEKKRSEPLAHSSQLSETDENSVGLVKSNASVVSRGKGTVADGTVEQQHEVSWTAELNEAETTAEVPAKPTASAEESSTATAHVDTVVGVKSPQHGAGVKSPQHGAGVKSPQHVAGGRESPMVESRATRSTRSSATKSPSPLKETVVPPATVEATPVVEKVAAVVEKKADEKPRKLPESMSVEEEKLDYGEIEPEEDVTMKEVSVAAKLDEPKSDEPRGLKRRQSPDKVTTSSTTSDKMAEVMRARSEKFGVPLVEPSKEIKEPPRKMARSGLSVSIPKDSSSQSTAPRDRTSPPASRSPVTRMIYIRNLVRPFSLPMLKELLQKTGTLVDDAEHFWIDGIKSQCIATYSTEEEAEASRKALFGLTWPATNPQKLTVEFIREEDFKNRSSTPSIPTGLLPGHHHESSRRPTVGPTPLSARPHIDRPAVEKLKITVASNKETGEAHRDVALAREEKRLERRAEREKELETVGQGKDGDRSADIADKASEREWDRGKSLTLKEKDLEQTPTKPVGTALEILFQRTETRPQLYWKPLTDEEIKMREEEEARNAAARDDRRKQLDQERAQRDREESKAGFDRSRRGSSRDRRLGGGGPGRRDNSSPRRRSRSRGRDDRGYRGGGGGGGGRFNRRNNSPGPSYRGGGRRRSPTPTKFRSGGGGGGRRSSSRSRRH